MQESYLGRIHPDMEVCDINGDKVGTVARLHRPVAPQGEEVVEVKTGLLGLGTHYYVPVSAVQDATPSCVFLANPKADFEGLGWHQRPRSLGEVE